MLLKEAILLNNKIIKDNKITFVYPNNEDEIKKIIDNMKLKAIYLYIQERKYLIYLMTRLSQQKNLSP